MYTYFNISRRAIREVFGFRSSIKVAIIVDNRSRACSRQRNKK